MINSAEQLLSYVGKTVPLPRFYALVDALKATNDGDNAVINDLKKIANSSKGKYSHIDFAISKKSQTYKTLKALSLPNTGYMTLGELDELGIELSQPTLDGAGNNNFFAEVSRRILELIKQGTLPWRMPWNENFKDGSEENIYMANYITNKNYRGINRDMCMWFGQGDKYFLSEKQIQQRGGTIINRKKSIPIGYFVRSFKTETVERENPDGQTELVEVKYVIQGMKWYRVYGLSNIENLKPIVRKTVKRPKGLNFEPIEICEKIVDSYIGKPRIEHKGNAAFYSPSSDVVTMPPKASFGSVPEYYSTLFHELLHSTGHPRRINRLKPAKFGSKVYAQEELVAELGSSFLCSISKIDYYTLNNTASYLKNWSSKLIQEMSSDKTFFLRTQFAAQKAAKYMMGKFYAEWEKSLEMTDKPAKKAKKEPEKATAQKPVKVAAKAKKPKKTVVTRFNAENETDLLAEFLKGKRIKTASWDRFADRNNRSKAINLNWLSSQGMPLDKLAHGYLMEQGLNGRYDEDRVIQDIVEFVQNNPGGVRSYMKKRLSEQSEDKENPMLKEGMDMKDFWDNFQGLSGKNQDPETVVYVSKGISKEIAKAANITPGKIKIKVGNSKFGLRHIALAHGKEIYNPLKYVVNIIDNFEALSIAKDAYKILLFKKDEKYGMAVLEMRYNIAELYIEDKGYYSVITAYPISNRKYKQFKKQWVPANLSGTEHPSYSPPSNASSVIFEGTEFASGSGHSSTAKEQKVYQKRFLSASELAETEIKTLELPGAWKQWLGRPAPNFDMVVYGGPGSRKTTLLLMLADDLAAMGKKIAFATSEEFGSPTLASKVKYLNVQDVDFAGHYKDFDLQQYDVLFIDSINDMRVTLDEYKALRKQYPHLAVIFILQSTKQGSFRGGQDWIHEPEIQIKMSNGETMTQKNRWNAEVTEINLNA